MLRKYMGYPPYSDMFQIVFTSDDREAALAGARSWHSRFLQQLEPDEKSSVFAPQEAYMSRIKDTYRYSMLIKCLRGRRREYSRIIEEIKEQDRKEKKRNYTAVVDINPYSFV